MSIISIRLSDEEKDMLEKFAEFEGKSVSGYLKSLFYEKLEDFEDLKEIKSYEKSNEFGKKGIPFDDAMKDLGI